MLYGRRGRTSSRRQLVTRLWGRAYRGPCFCSPCDIGDARGRAKGPAGHACGIGGPEVGVEELRWRVSYSEAPLGHEANGDVIPSRPAEPLGGITCGHSLR